MNNDFYTPGALDVLQEFADKLAKISPRLSQFFGRVEVIPFIFSPGDVLVQFRTPQFIADIDAITPPKGTDKDETPIYVVLQIPIRTYSLILIKSFNEI
jgi:hypothetical protein